MLKSPASNSRIRELSGVHPHLNGTADARPTTKRATQAERTQEARARIIDAAFACLAEDGYQHTTLIEIAKRAGCSRELPRYHFGTKDQLMEALVDEIQAYWRAIFEKQQTSNITALEALYQTADWIGKEMNENSTSVRGFAVLVFCAADPTNNALHRKIAASQKRTRGFFRTIVVRHMTEHPELEPLNADAIAALIYGIFRGLGYQWLIDPEGVSVDALLSEFKRLCPTLLSAPARAARPADTIFGE
jgi:AcrR family transcriptional regulator